MSEPIAKILVVEDEPTVRISLQDILAYEGYEVVACENGVEGLEAFSRENPDLVLLDWMMPGLDGLEVCRRIRAEWPLTPIVMLTAKGAEVDKVLGLELGADAYFTKPFGPRELIAQIKRLLRRMQAHEVDVSSRQEDNGPIACEELVFEDVVIDFRTYRARRGEDEIQLSAKEFELLKYLSSRPDVPVSRDQLLDHVWGYNSYPSTRTVDNFIARLRHKVEPVPDQPRYILTVHGVGYKFVYDIPEAITGT